MIKVETPIGSPEKVLMIYENSGENFVVTKSDDSGELDIYRISDVTFKLGETLKDYIIYKTGDGNMIVRFSNIPEEDIWNYIEDPCGYARKIADI
ncbi:hypothetical protein ACQQ2Q_12940 [Agrobacterium sp. ES01]|uniref:hypothetical protein n=1 Tax=Agrobacterium sp. ES01 TaxID=3420714 RepID=UPI003D10D6E0